MSDTTFDYIIIGAGTAGSLIANRLSADKTKRVLLSREQTALVIGAVLLFIVLAVVMTLTRKLDWYGLTSGNPRGE